MAQATAHAEAPAGKNYNGVKGWLLVLVVVLGIGLVMNIFGFSRNLDVLGDPSTTAAFELYPALKSILYFEIAVLAAAAVAGLTSMIMIVKRKKIAKYVVGGLLIGVIITGIIDTVWLNSVLADNPAALEEVDTTKDMMQAIVVACLWIPYLAISKRVKATLTQ